MSKGKTSPIIERLATPLFFTPSYRNDLDRLLLMRRSIKRFYCGFALHVIAVPLEDLKIFQDALSGDTCKVIAQQSLVRSEFFPSRGYNAFKKLFPNQAWRINRFAGKGGWIIQQVAKLMAAELVENGPIVILDSDVFFVRPFDDCDLFPKEGRLLVRITPDTESGRHRKHIANSRKILGLAEGSTEHNYMSCPAIIYAEWTKKLMIYIENLWGKPWQLVLLEQETISEYSIYGVFVEEVLKPNDLIIRSQSYNHMLWDFKSYTNFFSDVQGKVLGEPEKICVVAQSALNISAIEYSKKLESILG